MYQTVRKEFLNLGYKEYGVKGKKCDLPHQLVCWIRKTFPN